MAYAQMLDEATAAMWRVRELEREERQRRRDMEQYGQALRDVQLQQFVTNGTANGAWQNDFGGLGNVISAGITGGWLPAATAQAIAEKKPVPAKPKTSMLETIDFAEMDAENARMGLAVEAEDLLGYTALRKDAKAPSRLERMLMALEIDAYQPEKVQTYKDKMKAHFQVKADNVDRERLTKNPYGRPTQTTVSWRMVALDKYTKPVPEHVLRKCVQIKKAAPEAKFFVDELVQETRTLDPFMVVQLGEDKAFIEVWDEPEFEE